LSAAPGSGGGGAGASGQVIVVNDSAAINGGQAKVAIRSARMLAEAGREVTFFAASGPVDAGLDHPRIRTVCLGQADILSEPRRAAAARRGLWNGRAARELRAICAAADPDDTVVHCHGFAKALSPSIGPVLTGGPLAAVFTMHEYFLACPNGGFFDFRRNEICTRRPLGAACLATNCDVRHLSHKVWRVARQAATWTAGRMPSGLTDVIYISELQRKVMQPHLGPRTQLHHVPNPTPVDGGAVAARANDVFLFVGRLSPEKGCTLFAEAARMAGARAVFAGDGPERGRILATNPEAVVTGWLGPDEVQEWIGRARCLVFPSLWYECQPLAPMEALARGVPVVTGTWNAAAEVVEHGATGLLVETASARAFAEAIEALARDDHPVFAAIPGHPVPLTSDEAHLRRLTEVYASLLDARRRQRGAA
jgi:glycosyltransferase involved in cell wall biosynthesis